MIILTRSSAQHLYAYTARICAIESPSQLLNWEYGKNADIVHCDICIY